MYVDRSDIREGRLEDLEEGIRRLVEFIETHEPRLIEYSFHLDEEAGRMTVVAVHPDSASLELHQETGGPEFRKLGDLVTLRQIEVFGAVSERARDLLRQKAAALGDAGCRGARQVRRLLPSDLTTSRDRRVRPSWRRAR